jgi:hypothetical protein
MSRMRLVLVAVAATLPVVTLAAPRRAGAEPVVPWANLGVSEIVLLPDPAHYAVYVYAAVTLPIATSWHEWYVIPGLAFEIAPEVARGGLVGSVTLEHLLSARVAGDVIVSLVHDQTDLDFDTALFSLGLGAGVSIAVGDFSLSPSCSVYRVIAGGAGDWSLAPTLNLAHAF